MPPIWSEPGLALRKRAGNRADALLSVQYGKDLSPCLGALLRQIFGDIPDGAGKTPERSFTVAGEGVLVQPRLARGDVPALATILVVDDHAYVRRTIRAVLEQQGHRKIYEAENGMCHR